MAMAPDPQNIAPDVGLLTDVMGGYFLKVSNLLHLLHCMENCIGTGRRYLNVLPMQPVCHIEGVAICLESHPDNLVQRPFERMFIYANRTGSKYFPMPEQFWPNDFLPNEIRKFVCFI